MLKRCVSHLFSSLILKCVWCVLRRNEFVGIRLHKCYIESMSITLITLRICMCCFDASSFRRHLEAPNSRTFVQESANSLADGLSYGMLIFLYSILPA